MSPLSDATAKDAGGTVVARLSRQRDFLGLLRQQSTDDQVLNQLTTKTQRTYLPDGGVQVGPGTRSYAVVLVGNALQPPLTVEAAVTVDTGEPRTFTFQWKN